MIRTAFVLLALAAAAACRPAAQNAEEYSSAEAAIEAATEAWISAWEQGDVDTLANLYEEDAMYAANTGEVSCARQTAVVPDDDAMSTLRSHPEYSNQPVVFVNLLDFGSAEAQARYLNEYAAPVMEVISARGGSLLWAGAVDQQLVGNAGDAWDYAAFVRWPSRAAFVSAFESDDYRKLHDVREETLRSTLIMVASEAGSPEE